MSLDATPKDDYRWLLPVILENLGGSARAFQILAEIAMDIHFRPEDAKVLSNGEERWKNWARWVRKDLTRNGTLRTDSAFGWWELA